MIEYCHLVWRHSVFSTLIRKKLPQPVGARILYKNAVKADENAFEIGSEWIVRWFFARGGGFLCWRCRFQAEPGLVAQTMAAIVASPLAGIGFYQRIGYKCKR